MDLVYDIELIEPHRILHQILQASQEFRPVAALLEYAAKCMQRINVDMGPRMTFDQRTTFDNLGSKQGGRGICQF